MSNPIFRQKSIEKITSPEQINDYIRVSNPSIWMVLAAVIVLLAGVCVWGVYGRLDTVVKTGGVCKEGQLTVYLDEDHLPGADDSFIVSVDGTEYEVSGITAAPVRINGDTDAYLLYLAGFSDGDWVYAFSVDIPDLGDGTYAVSVITDRVRPLDFVLGDYRTDSGSTVLRADERPVFAVLAEVRK